MELFAKANRFYQLTIFTKSSILKVRSYKSYNTKYMIASTQITNTEIFAFIVVLVFKLLSRKVLFINRKGNKTNFCENSKFHGLLTAKLQLAGMQNFQDTFETLQLSFISAFSIFITVPLTL